MTRFWLFKLITANLWFRIFTLTNPSSIIILATYLPIKKTFQRIRVETGKKMHFWLATVNAKSDQMVRFFLNDRLSVVLM
jgi:hypothetical protein